MRHRLILGLSLALLCLAHAAQNDDLVFDQDGKLAIEETPLIESQHEQTIFHRIKRGFWDLFKSPSANETPPVKDQEAEAQNLVLANSSAPEQRKAKKSAGSSERQIRESGEDNEYVDEVDNEVGDAAEGRRVPQYENTDDEDLAGSGEIEGSATETEDGSRPVHHMGGKAKFYRITLTVGEPYRREYSDRNSHEYKELSGNITQALEDLYNRHIPGYRHFGNIVKVSPTSDAFTSQVTVDLGSTFTEEAEVRAILEQQLQYHSLGSIQVAPEGFSFRIFQAEGGEQEQECDPSSELRCRNGACIPLESRCDGVAQCEDASDENDCPSTRDQRTTLHPSAAETTTLEPEDKESGGGDDEYDEYTVRPTSDKCRADDTVRCQDGSRYICSIQRCDGIPDCDDAGDEYGCPHPGCSAGEFACDVSRCILESEKCNFVEDCQDGSDEHDCHHPACTSTQFQCRNGECIHASNHCDGVPDCHDSSDELTCPCGKDQFECTPGFCVPLSRRCDGTMDCYGGADERDCDHMTRCRPDEFECDNGMCVSRNARCDGRHDCQDYSDEYNCNVTTCSGEQFRCLDGICLNIDKRCNGVEDCRSGEDESQCGCGDGEFRCADGRCIGYELQCNGVNECTDGSDERECDDNEIASRESDSDESATKDTRDDIQWYQYEVPTNQVIGDPIKAAYPELYELRNSTGRILSEHLVRGVRHRIIKDDNQERRHGPSNFGKVFIQLPRKFHRSLKRNNTSATGTEKSPSKKSKKQGGKPGGRRKNRRNRLKHVKEVRYTTLRTIKDFLATTEDIDAQTVSIAPEISLSTPSTEKSVSSTSTLATSSSVETTDGSNIATKSAGELWSVTQSPTTDFSQDSGSRENVNGLWAKKSGGFYKYFKKYLKKTVPSTTESFDEPPASTEVLKKPAESTEVLKKPTKVEGELFESNNVDHEFDKDFISKDRLIKISKKPELQKSSEDLNATALHRSPDNHTETSDEISSESIFAVETFDPIISEVPRPRWTTTTTESNEIGSEPTPKKKKKGPKQGNGKNNRGKGKRGRNRKTTTSTALPIETTPYWDIETSPKTSGPVFFEPSTTETESPTESSDSTSTEPFLYPESTTEELDSTTEDRTDGPKISLGILGPETTTKCVNSGSLEDRLKTGLPDAVNCTHGTSEAPVTMGPIETDEAVVVQDPACPCNKTSPNAEKQTTTTKIPRTTTSQDESQEDNCRGDQHACSKDICLEEEKVCDGVVDCIDASDEWDCDNYYKKIVQAGGDTKSPQSVSPTWRPCGAGEFECHGVCLLPIHICDGYKHCRDGSDEANCQRSPGLAPCPSMDFTCSDGSCIPRTAVCDGFDDCPRTEDELHCERQCTPTQFRCVIGNKCIEGVYRCDGHPDCPDHSDEDCHNQTITHASPPTSDTRWQTDAPPSRGCDPQREMRCDNGQCVLLRRKCDNVFDCLDGSDERGCECPDGELPCENGVCINKNFFCDQNVDCLDGSDEHDCPDTGETGPSYPAECTRDEFTCHDGSCIPRSAMCDGRADCPHDEDEVNCPRGDTETLLGTPDEGPGGKPPDWGEPVYPVLSPTQNQSSPRSCAADDFVCADGTCIPETHHCDHFYDCRDFTDEQYCFGCSRDQFQCANGDCINSQQLCDGYINCDDGSDEPDDCETTPMPDKPGVHPMPGRCPSGQFMCIVDQHCIPHSGVCNGIPECRDRSDEDNCGPHGDVHGLNLKTYPSDQVIKENPAKQGREVVFQCRDEGPLRARVHWLRGHNLPLPPGSRDVNGRLEIPNIQLEHAGPYICEAVDYPSYTPGAQMIVNLTVDRHETPPTRAPRICGYEEATCSNGECIPKSSVCNGKLECTDGSDEMRCSLHGCEPNQFRCNSRECVSKVWRCDGERDCADGSDEEECAPAPPGSPCKFNEFTCGNNQCILKSFHCDLEKDCQDGSDEIGCSKVFVTVPPKPMVVLDVGESLTLTCTAIGVPTPEILWRLNWGHVPAKCNSVSTNGTGTLHCPDMQPENQGAYSCEAINTNGFVIAIPDAVVMVKKPQNICPKGQFNSEARTVEECIPCFCFGVATQCQSANLFTYHLPPPFDAHRFVSVQTSNSYVHLQRDVPLDARPLSHGVQLTDSLAQTTNDLYHSGILYFALPESYHRNQLKSYGGYLRYKVKYGGPGYPNDAPQVIVTGNNRTLVHKGRNPRPDHESEESVRFFFGEWHKVLGNREEIASREDIMMTLENVDDILIKAKYEDSMELDIKITDITMDTADVRNTGLGSASFVEECQCPSGYSGLSCEQCAPGFQRQQSGPWLGQCIRDEPPCPPGYYGDPTRNIECQVCPCPHTNPSNQFARTCHLGSDGQPTCDCPAGYVGRRCEQCAAGYQGNPLIPGDMCVPTPQCDPDGSIGLQPDPYTGQCRCKQFATGLHCNQCKANTFNLASANQFGCISCFCMGITKKCVSSNWYRNEVRVSFTNSVRGFSLIEARNTDADAIVDSIRLDTISREIVFRDFPNHGNNDVYYWDLPSIFLGDQITSYGGNLKYTVRYVPSPGGQSSRNNAADVELISENNINLLYFSRETIEPNMQQTFTVPLFEQYWQRSDGTQADREHLLMALADVRAIRIKATYTTHTDEAALSFVSLDTAEKYNTGGARAMEVEECGCPAGYKGLSCEDCDVGYTRAVEGLYLGICEPCNCNGHSGQCDPETGVCENCAHHTTGDNCEVCEPGFEGDATRGTPNDCSHDRPRPGPCRCDPAGSRSEVCIGGRCECRRNVEGPECNRCRPSTFGLSADNHDGCMECYCSGVSNECHESSLFVQQIPIWVYDAQHGFTLTDSTRREVISDGFELNVAMNEIGYRYPDSRGRRLFWSLPAVFTGNKVKSYGGHLNLTQHITTDPGAQSYRDQDVLLIGNGITLFWTNPNELQPDVPLTYSVPLKEAEWKRLGHDGPRVASRTDMMTVLSNLEAILVRATHSNRMTATYISDISLDTAVESHTSNRRATQVEACRCPPGYTGTSCESCARGYYRDTMDRSTSFLGSCNTCPCNKNEESCEITRTGSVKCHCLPGYTGEYCQDVGDLMVSLKPMNGHVQPRSSTKFTCSYEYPADFYIYFKLSRHEDAPLTARGNVPSHMSVTEKGAVRTWQVHIDSEPVNVECHILDIHGRQLVRIVTTVTPVSVDTTTPPSPTIYPPRIVAYVQEPEFQIVQTGNTVTYHCTGRSLDSDSLRINWQKEGGHLPPGRSVTDIHGLLVIRDVKVSDSGVYVCQVSDGTNIGVKKVTLSVGGSNPVEPRVMITPNYLNVTEGDPVEFRCEASGNPPPHVEWVRIHGPMSEEASFHNGLWRLRAASKSDAAEYKCIARNSIGVSERSTTLYVRDNPDRPQRQQLPIITPQQWIGHVGDLVRLDCTPVRHENVTWSRSGNLPLPYSASQHNGVLTIRNPSISDTGVYICSAVSSRGIVTSTTASITIEARIEQPSITVQPQRQTVSQGSTVEVRCLTQGNSGLKVHWSKYKQDMGPNTQQVGDTLRIINARLSDRGIYICRVIGADGPYEASAVIEVEPREAPRLELHPRDIQAVVLGGSADLQCRAIAGIPTPELHWSRQDGRPFSQNIEQLPGGLLRLSNITILDGGAYVCSAMNEVGSTSAVAHIEVQSMPLITISPKVGILQVKLGDRIRLVCSASGHPQPHVTWGKHVNGLTVYDPYSESGPTPLSAVHEIFSVSADDEGSYTCQASNAVGITEERIYIRIDEDNEVYPCRGDMACADNKQRPAHPDHDGGVQEPGDLLRIPDGGKMEIRCRAQTVEGGDHIYLDWKRADNHRLPEGSTVHNGVLTIPSVDKTAAGEYVCLGLDRAGNVLFKVKSRVEVISPPRIELNPTRQVVGPGEDPSIRCSATGDEPMQIEWSAIGRPLPPSVSQDRGVLQFHGIAFNDAGKYVCKAWNDAGTAQAVAEVLVNEHPDDEWPIRALQKDVVTQPGSSVRLRCEVREHATIRWSREGQSLPPNARTHEDYLELRYVRPEHSGRYICTIENHHGVSSDYVNLSVHPAVAPAVSVEVSQDPVNIGDTIDIRCACTGAPNPRYRWSRPNHPHLPANAEVYGNVLRLSSVAVGDSGTYRCTADTAEGTFENDFNLVVHGGHNDAPAIETKSAPYGSSLEMACKVDLDPPVKFHWSKLAGLLPRNAHAFDSKLKLYNVTADDAGTYICTANNDHMNIDVPTMLVVTGVVPNFNQAPESYIALPPLPDSYLKFNIEISFKPESYDGAILYNSESNRDTGDFIALSLVRGYPHFRFNLGSGAAVIRAEKPVSLSEWHTIKIRRNRKEGTMLVDGEGLYRGVTTGRKQGLDLAGPLYIGGVPSNVSVNKHAEVQAGFVGCISRLVIGEKQVDLMGEQTDSVGITNCETCAENPCNNAGVCQEAATVNGYTCLCRAGYSGKHCDYVGQSCYPGACGDGTCVDKEGGFECYCPRGKVGPRCEHSINIHDPGFNDDRAFIAHDTPKAFRRLKVSLNFNPLDESNGILMYAAQSDEGLGDFAALVVKDRRVEFRYDIGSGVAVLRSTQIVQPGVWSHVSISRDFKEGNLSVNGEEMIEGRSPGAARTMNLNTPLYIGGVDRRRIAINKNAAVDQTFRGCISDLELESLGVDILRDSLDAANIDNCNILHPNQTKVTPTTSSTTRYDPCASAPCIHGTCAAANAYDYSCTCEYGYVGSNCENVYKSCEFVAPCKNNGICTNLLGTYKCDCPLGFGGVHCEEKAKIEDDVSFTGDGWLELVRSVMPHEEEREVLGFEIATNKSNGLIMWHGQTPNDLSPDDYISLAVVDGFVEYQYNLGSGPAIIRVTAQRVDDGERHRIILKRQGSDGSIELNGEHTESGVSDGLQQILNTRGSVYLGGVPDYAMTYQRYHEGFSGCIYTMEVQDSGAIHIGDKAIRGINVSPCTRSKWIPSSLVFTDTSQFDVFAPPPPVNIIHPKPAANVAARNAKHYYLLILLRNLILFVAEPRERGALRAVLCPDFVSALMIRTTYHRSEETSEESRIKRSREIARTTTPTSVYGGGKRARR